MRLDFNVLWVDDQPNSIDAQIKAIDKQMESEGFRFVATACKSVDEIRDVVKDNVFTDEIDLILTDWDLGGGLQGQDAIAVIRESVKYKDVVFYSAQTPVDTLRTLAFEKGLEGVYCTSRADLVDEVLGVFESLVKKVLDLDHTRGIVMGATSDIDQTVRECLLAMHLNLDADGKGQMIKTALGYIDEGIEKHADTAGKLKNATTLEELFEAHNVLTTNDRLRMLARALKMKAFEAHKGYRQSVTAYLEKTVRKRNALGHQVLIPQGKPSVVTLTGKTVTIEEMRQLRKLILDLRTDFRKLLLALQEGGSSTAAEVIVVVAE